MSRDRRPSLDFDQLVIDVSVPVLLHQDFIRSSPHRHQGQLSTEQNAITFLTTCSSKTCAFWPFPPMDSQACSCFVLFSPPGKAVQNAGKKSIHGLCCFFTSNSR